MEYQINKFITLKLEKERTVIYINGERFNQCQKIVLNIPLDKHEILYDNNIKSIDEMVELYQSIEYENEYDDYAITPEEEFRVHCSNIQTWVEYDYDTKLMHTNLAFPMLKKLYEIGDEKAKRVFKEEIVSRFLSESESVVQYLVHQKYLDYFTYEELLVLFDDFSATRLMHTYLAFPLLKKLYEIGDEKARKIVKEEIVSGFLSESESVVDYLVYKKYLDYFTDEELALLISDFSKTELSHLILESELINYFMKVIPLLDPQSELLNSIEELEIGFEYELKYIPSYIDKLTSLKILNIHNPKFFITTLPESIGNLHSLQILNISIGIKELPESIGNLQSLRSLSIQNSSLISLPQSFGNLRSLQYLGLNCGSAELPESFGALHSLRKLDLSGLTKLPESFGNLHSLQVLRIHKSYLKELPESFGNLHSLETLYIRNSNLKELPESFGNLHSLEELYIVKDLSLGKYKLPSNFDSLPKYSKKGYQRLNKLPDSFDNLRSLRVLNLSNNDLTELPESFGGLPSLQELNLSNNNLIELPESFGDLPSLQWVDLCKNKLTELPKSFGNLLPLRWLNLKDNQLPDYYKKIYKLLETNLRKLKYQEKD